MKVLNAKVTWRTPLTTPSAFGVHPSKEGNDCPGALRHPFKDRKATTPALNHNAWSQAQSEQS